MSRAKIRVGMIGLGSMGRPLAGRLLQSGFEVVAFDVDAPAVAELVQRGALPGSSPMDVASRTEIVLACLPSPEVSERVALGADGIVQGTCVRQYVEMSTIGVDSMQRIESALAKRSIALLDAPVSGGRIGAANGRLTCFVAGPRAHFDTASPALRGLCDRLFHIGERPGQAQVLKLANNMLNAANLCLAVEMILMARKAGIDEATAVEVINVSTGRSRATEETFKTQILTGAFDTGGKLAIAHKDVVLAVEQARKLGVEHSVAHAACGLWQAAAEAGHGGEDLSRIYQFVAALNDRDSGP
ncbi:NAD(P)-dependent oxidoreductase [Variovorax sp. Sphag1AA]|uniref:NAD(P)-dependent oxidoreductase n=1 Tax=Variovorax sp. Sphag1AA TaxID=2587027 RepID=UPI00161E0A17|nr:NAD(P)-dependent oxidoreductase [Variovorax sp. Sphag1AA]MBB3181033.1 3-hydroxyisobutyrate dehydrogenase/2-hydroxy-3-oxopropionate reductase [Variovorax sp. Sphag1AA]